MKFEVTIDKVPVHLDVKIVGPASLEDIDSFREKLNSGDVSLSVCEILDSNSEEFCDDSSEVQVVLQEVSQEEVSQEEVSQEEVSQEEVSQEEVSQEEVSQEKNAKNKEVLVTEKSEKPWYYSKTLISNVLAIIACVLGIIVTNNPGAVIPAAILAIINVYLRSITKDSIKPLKKKN